MPVTIKTSTVQPGDPDYKTPARRRPHTPNLRIWRERGMWRMRWWKDGLLTELLTAGLPTALWAMWVLRKNERKAR